MNIMAEKYHMRGLKSKLYTVPVPEPGTFAMIAMGIVGISVIGFLRNAVG